MPANIPQRLVWAVETLAIQPADRLLEIGCGQGVAAGLIADKLSGGKLIAIDRSLKLIEAASRRNQAHVTAGKVEFRPLTLAEADFGAAQFDKIFAINVNVFWLKPANELRVIASALQPEGRLYLFYEPPDPAKNVAIIEQLKKNLREHGFHVQAIIVNDLKPIPGFGVIARKA